MNNMSPEVEYYSILVIFFIFFVFFLVFKNLGSENIKQKINLFFSLAEDDDEPDESEIRINSLVRKLVDHAGMIYIAFIIAGAIWWIGGKLL